MIELIQIVILTGLLIYVSTKVNVEGNIQLIKRAFPILLVVKFCVSYFIYILYTRYYTVRTDADIFKYFDDSLVIFNYLKQHPSDIWRIFVLSDLPSELGPEMITWFTGWGVHLVDSNQSMIKLHLLLHPFSFGNYHVHALAFCFLSFIGSVKLYNSIVKYLHINPLISFACIVFPSLLLWTSAPLKETIVVFFLFWALAKLIQFVFENELKQLVFSVLLMLPLFFVKPYFVIGLFPLLPLLLIKNIRAHYKYIIALAVLVVIAFFVTILPNGQTIIGGIIQKQHDFLNHAEAENAGSLIYLPRLEGNYWSLITTIPIALFNLFLKPLPWDSLNPLFLIASLENLLLIALIFIAIIFKKNSFSPEQKELLWLLSFYSIIIYTLIGLTTPVVGAFVRYKAPVLPLILIVCFIVLDFEKIKKYVPFKKYL